MKNSNNKTPSVFQPRAFLMRYVVFGIGLRNIIISIILCFVNVLFQIILRKLICSAAVFDFRHGVFIEMCDFRARFIKPIKVDLLKQKIVYKSSE